MYEHLAKPKKNEKNSRRKDEVALPEFGNYLHLRTQKTDLENLNHRREAKLRNTLTKKDGKSASQKKKKNDLTSQLKRYTEYWVRH